MSFGPSASATTSATVRATTSATTSATVRAKPRTCANATLRPQPNNLAAIDTATVCLIDRVRAAAHLQPLRFNAPLQGVARGQALDMVRGDYFSDDSLLGRTPMQRVLASAYPLRASNVQVAQNIGWATGAMASPAGMLAAWMCSAPHRAIILTAAFRDIGVGVAPSAPPSLAQGLAGATYTLELGERSLNRLSPRS
jgi:uncharacterized protein YkwD